MAASRSWARMIAMTGAALAVTGLLVVPLSGSDAATTGAADPPPTEVATTTTVADAMQGPAVADEPAERGWSIQVTPTFAPPATAVGDSLEIPAGSGSGRRVVYSKSFMRVWMIEQDGTLFHTHRVSGRDDQPRPGTYTVWSRSENTCSRSTPSICMRFMVRFAFSFRGDNIGFHEIPRRYGVPLQDTSELGLALSGGCVRQSTDDALLMWTWAQLGTVVVVVV